MVQRKRHLRDDLRLLEEMNLRASDTILYDNDRQIAEFTDPADAQRFVALVEIAKHGVLRAIGAELRGARLQNAQK